MNKRFGVTLDSKTLVKAGTLQTIENEILKHLMSGNEDSSAADNSHSTLPTPHSTTTPLSYAQTGVYFECLKNPTSTVYNIPYLLSYPAGIEACKLADIVKQIVEAHPELSIHFTTEGDAIVQTLASLPVEVSITEMSDEALAAYKNACVRSTCRRHHSIALRL